MYTDNFNGLATLYDTYLTKLSYTYNIDGYTHDDLKQEFLMALNDCNNGYDPCRGVTFDNYLFSVIKRRVRDLLLKQRPKTISLDSHSAQIEDDLLAPIEVQDLACTPEEQADFDKTVTCIKDTADRVLMGTAKEVFNLRVYENHSFYEIAKLTGLTRPGATWVFNNAVKEVRRAMGLSK